MTEKHDDDIDRAARARGSNPFLTPEQAALYLGICVRTLQQMRSNGKGPAFRRHTRHVSYHIDDLTAWSRAQREGADHD